MPGTRRAERAERQAVQARLSALPAQVEPHFLFNTPAHVAGLIDALPRPARAMVERLAELLRACPANGRASQTTVGTISRRRAPIWRPWRSAWADG